MPIIIWHLPSSKDCSVFVWLLWLNISHSTAHFCLIPFGLVTSEARCLYRQYTYVFLRLYLLWHLQYLSKVCAPTELPVVACVSDVWLFESVESCSLWYIQNLSVVWVVKIGVEFHCLRILSWPLSSRKCWSSWTTILNLCTFVVLQCSGTLSVSSNATLLHLHSNHTIQPFHIDIGHCYWLFNTIHVKYHPPGRPHARGKTRLIAASNIHSPVF